MKDRKDLFIYFFTSLLILLVFLPLRFQVFAATVQGEPASCSFYFHQQNIEQEEVRVLSEKVSEMLAKHANAFAYQSARVLLSAIEQSLNVELSSEFNQILDHSTFDFDLLASLNQTGKAFVENWSQDLSQIQIDLKKAKLQDKSLALVAKNLKGVSILEAEIFQKIKVFHEKFISEEAHLQMMRTHLRALEMSLRQFQDFLQQASSQELRPEVLLSYQNLLERLDAHHVSAVTLLNQTFMKLEQLSLVSSQVFENVFLLLATAKNEMQQVKLNLVAVRVGTRVSVGGYQDVRLKQLLNEISFLLEEQKKKQSLLN